MSDIGTVMRLPRNYTTWWSTTYRSIDGDWDFTYPVIISYKDYLIARDGRLAEITKLKSSYTI